MKPIASLACLSVVILAGACSGTAIHETPEPASREAGAGAPESAKAADAGAARADGDGGANASDGGGNDASAAELEELFERPKSVLRSPGDVTCSQEEIPAGGSCRIATYTRGPGLALERAHGPYDRYLVKLVVDERGRERARLTSGLAGDQIFAVADRRTLLDPEGRRTGDVEIEYACRGVPWKARESTWTYADGHLRRRDVRSDTTYIDTCNLDGTGVNRVHQIMRDLETTEYEYDDGVGTLIGVRREMVDVLDVEAVRDEAGRRVYRMNPVGKRAIERATLERDAGGRVVREHRQRVFPRGGNPWADTFQCTYDGDGRVTRLEADLGALYGGPAHVVRELDWATATVTTTTRREGAPTLTETTRYATLTPLPTTTAALGVRFEDYQTCDFWTLVKPDVPDPLVRERPRYDYLAEHLSLAGLNDVALSSIRSVPGRADEPLQSLSCVTTGPSKTCTIRDEENRATYTWTGTRSASNAAVFDRVDLRSTWPEESQTDVLLYDRGRLSQVTRKHTTSSGVTSIASYAHRYDGDRLVEITGSLDGQPYLVERYTYPR